MLFSNPESVESLPRFPKQKIKHKKLEDISAVYPASINKCVIYCTVCCVYTVFTVYTMVYFYSLDE